MVQDVPPLPARVGAAGDHAKRSPNGGKIGGIRKGVPAKLVEPKASSVSYVLSSSVRYSHRGSIRFATNASTQSSVLFCFEMAIP